MQYANSLIGQQFKTITEVNVFHIYDLVDTTRFLLTKAVGEITMLLWLPEIQNIECPGTFLNDFPAFSLFVALLSCFVMLFLPCPSHVALLMCPCCHIVFMRVNGGRYFWMVVVVFVCGGHFSHPLLTDY